MILLNSNSFCHFISCNVKTQKWKIKKVCRLFTNFLRPKTRFFLPFKTNFKVIDSKRKRKGQMLLENTKFVGFQCFFGLSADASYWFSVSQNRLNKTILLFSYLVPNKIKTHVLVHFLIHILMRPAGLIKYSNLQRSYDFGYKVVPSIWTV